MKKRFFSVLLALVMCLGLLPATASAAENNLPDWYFLFAIFKNVDADVKDWEGNVTHQTYTMPQDEIDAYQEHAQEFETYMNQVGVMHAHVDVIEISETVTELGEYSGGSKLTAENAEPFLKDKVDLDKYDHVFCIISLNVSTRYSGVTGAAFANGTGQSCINLKNRDSMLKNYSPKGASWSWPPTLYVHEYLHFMEGLNKKWGVVFNEHNIQTLYNSNLIDGWKGCYTDIILNRVKGNAETGTGVTPATWEYPPHVLRTMTELTVPSGVTNIGEFAFAGNETLTRVFIPSSVTSIGGAAFQRCTNLTSVSLPTGITSVEGYTFANCPKLTDVYYSGSEAQWKAINISSTSNSALTKATIHYNHLMADVKTSDFFARPVAWAMEKGIAAGTGDGYFSPAADCTQAQILTFLWRAEGEPKPAGTVSGGKFYAAAMQWGREQRLIGRETAPNDPCTRADVMTYLWKLAGRPTASGTGFDDVPANADCAQAVAWAVKNKITAGTSKTTFSPDAVCTRGQIASFLYRALA